MDKTILVGPDLKEGAKFVELLRKAGVKLAGAFWQKNEDSEGWRLQIVTPLVDEIGVGGIFDTFTRILRESPSPLDIDLDYVYVVSPRSNDFKSLRRVFPKRPVTHPHWLTTSYIYFIK